MALIGIKSGSSFGSTKKFSFYERNKQWRAKQQQHYEKFQNQQAVASNMFAVGISSAQSATELLFQKVTLRMQNEAKAKLAERNEVIDKAIESIDLKV
ncbi:hypothetical protein [Stappia sp.]|jgi:hypothetical protein|uniref:hypothetical protein n=1 Tax=Stappia sp. TaxID=1870903 RepID=UPI003A9A4272